jgi:hypothetical protein
MDECYSEHRNCIFSAVFITIVKEVMGGAFVLLSNARSNCLPVLRLRDPTTIQGSTGSPVYDLIFMETLNWLKVNKTITEGDVREVPVDVLVINMQDCSI